MLQKFQKRDAIILTPICFCVPQSRLGKGGAKGSQVPPVLRPVGAPSPSLVAAFNCAVPPVHGTSQAWPLPLFLAAMMRCNAPGSPPPGKSASQGKSVYHFFPTTPNLPTFPITDFPISPISPIFPTFSDFPPFSQNTIPISPHLSPGKKSIFL